MNLEKRTVQSPPTLERQTPTGDGNTLSGYASVFYNSADPGTEYELFRDGDRVAVERIMPGAFSRFLSTGIDVVALFNHSPNHPLGRLSSGTLRLRDDSHGLFYEIDLGNTTVANDLREHLRRGDVSGSSFAFTVEDENLRRDGNRIIREVTDVNLWDVSSVLTPAYSAATSHLRSKFATSPNAASARARVLELDIKRFEQGLFA